MKVLEQTRATARKADAVVAADTTASEELLAWMGFEVPIKEDWRPLRMDGEHHKGSITVGDMNGPIFQLRWLRAPKGYDGREWIEKRRTDVAGGQKSPGAPQPRGFSHVSWIKDLSIREESQKTVWWGRSKEDGVLVEILLTNLCDPVANNWFLKVALPKLTVLPASDAWRWRVFSSRFMVPARYTLARKRLAAGDITLQFVRGEDERLTLRQVFPARLALRRRKLVAWLKHRPFRETRRIRAEAEDVESDNRAMISGWKNLPFPVGWLFPRHCRMLAVQDRGLDRLLIVEHEWAGPAPQESVDDLVAGMKWSAA
jgi:hypothetical protein